MDRYVLDLKEIDRTRAAVVGGKAAHLGELWRIEGVRVPAGFCVTTDAFARIAEQAPSLDSRLDGLSSLAPEDHEAISALSAEVRRIIEGIAIPEDVKASITAALVRLGPNTSCAVRSSASAEDLATASFAGQQDTYLNVVGAAAILTHLSRCWASLFTERAVTYRLRQGFEQRNLQMAVVVQEMVFSEAAGVLFTADPVTSNRCISSVEACFGLGEALVAGLTNTDVYTALDDKVLSRSVTSKDTAIHASPAGGTRKQAMEPALRGRPVLSDAQVLELVALGRRIEGHLGCAQDVEWCLGNDGFRIVQSRPITTLFPIPDTDEAENRVYVSVGHQQMMTDAIRPLGLSVWKLTSPAPMRDAGGRLFVDVTPRLADAGSRAALLDALGASDPLISDALRSILERGDFVRTRPEDVPGPHDAPSGAPTAPVADPIKADPAIVADLIRAQEASLAELKREIATKSATALLDFILTDISELKRILFDPGSLRVITTAMDATRWLNEHLHTWLGERNAADTLTQSVPRNVTSEMGLALLDVADVIRPHQDVVAFLQRVEDEGLCDERFLDGLAELAGGPEALGAIGDWLDEYGMRCVAEIDITRPRWSERPTMLVPVILGNVHNSNSTGAAEGRFERGREAALSKEQDLLGRLRTLPDGEPKVEQAKEMIDRVRTFIGYREYPKYHMAGRYFVYKQALLGEAERLVRAKVLREPHDIFYLTFQELHDVVCTRHSDDRLISERKAAFRSYQALMPPRVLTSQGEAVNGSYRREDLPNGALAGLAVSAGTVEGRARVVTEMTEADLQTGDILVTAYTDPAWTPLFVAISGLVTEVGGLMTHGAVIAREYGLPTVVGVQNATALIREGQRIRVNGTDGFVEILD